MSIITKQKKKCMNYFCRFIYRMTEIVTKKKNNIKTRTLFLWPCNSTLPVL